ncbi:hypothetical protein CTAYLR_001513 [Chrysophaeum taylorii]|uniref:Sugar phosphate transporter domain-containing protein n=1 Tax=Chrysophaeum taylorii TaxID=2483200 RepID=A0AAD7UFY1_9STRA|nr:hypothetical protein CTAYLR_001513 [Chrysophaeum taylorii]
MDKDVRVPLLAARPRTQGRALSTVGVLGAVALCGVASTALARLGSSTVMTTELAAAAASAHEPLPPSSLDFWMGILLRALAVLAVALAVMEIQLPSFRQAPQGAQVTVADRTEDGLAAKLLDGPPPKTAVSRLSELCAYLESALLILAYMAASIGIVYLNAYILKKWPYAATLTMLQMTFCSVASHGCVCAGLSDPSKVGMTAKLYVTICVPLAVLYTFYLYGSNAVYNFLPVGYIQLLKPAQAIAVYILLAIAGCETVAFAPILNLVVILGSVVIASVAQSEIAGWSTIGFVLMMVSNAAYACYLVGQQLMLNTKLGEASGQKSVKMDSISTLYFLGPATAVGLGLVAFAEEWRDPSFSFKGMPALLLAGDCLIAFSLNLIQIKIIGKLSALTYMFSGYVKGFLTVGISWVFYNEAVDGLEIGGYVVMLFGQLLWSLRKLRKRPDSQPNPSVAATDGGKPTIKTNAAIACAVLLACLIYAVAVNKCALVPCRD